MANDVALRVVLALAKPLGAAALKRIKQLKPIEQFRVEQAIETSVAEVWGSLEAFFSSERVNATKSLSHKVLIVDLC
jgi:hypothetical protein